VIAETMGISTKVIHYYLMLLLSVAVVASLTTVGVILVVAMLITPAATALLLTDRLHWAVAISGIVGVFSTVIGFIAAVLLDTTPGPAMTVVATILYLFAALFAPKKGLVFQTFRKRKLQHKIQLEDTLKQALKLNSKEKLSFSTLLKKVDFSKSALRTRLRKLQKNGFVKWDNNQVILTDAGQKEATKMVRAHRLWETYLVQEIGLTEEQIHEDAEKFEHLLTEELLDEVDLKLGFPTTDPHGSPIPKKLGIPDFPLINLPVFQNARIAQQQVNEHITAQLWKLGLLPNTTFTINKIEEKSVEVEMNGKVIYVPKQLAKQVNILS
jgi:Mn-dependent DtxR family transcriptional regulator/Fe2+ transport system protein FeoA